MLERETINKFLICVTRSELFLAKITNHQHNSHSLHSTKLEFWMTKINYSCNHWEMCWAFTLNFRRILSFEMNTSKSWIDTLRTFLAFECQNDHLVNNHFYHRCNGILSTKKIKNKNRNNIDSETLDDRDAFDRRIKVN